jgi:hypothetical protein
LPPHPGSHSQTAKTVQQSQTAIPTIKNIPVASLMNNPGKEVGYKIRAS